MKASCGSVCHGPDIPFIAVFSCNCDIFSGTSVKRDRLIPGSWDTGNKPRANRIFQVIGWIISKHLKRGIIYDVHGNLVAPGPHAHGFIETYMKAFFVSIAPGV